jgi:hypothetical protein
MHGGGGQAGAKPPVVVEGGTYDERKCDVRQEGLHLPHRTHQLHACAAQNTHDVAEYTCGSSVAFERTNENTCILLHKNAMYIALHHDDPPSYPWASSKY